MTRKGESCDHHMIDHMLSLLHVIVNERVDDVIMNERVDDVIMKDDVMMNGRVDDVIMTTE